MYWSLTPAAFEAQLIEKGYQEIVQVSRGADYALGEHAHPFDACALILEGSLTLTVDGAERKYGSGEVFELARGTLHLECAGLMGVTYIAGRKV